MPAPAPPRWRPATPRTQYHAHHATRRRTQSHADPDFGAPTAHRVGRHAVEAETGQQRWPGRQRSRTASRRSVLESATIDLLGEHAERDGDILVHLRQRASEALRQQRRRSSCCSDADRHGRGRIRLLLQREIPSSAGRAGAKRPIDRVFDIARRFRGRWRRGSVSLAARTASNEDSGRRSICARMLPFRRSRLAALRQHRRR